MGGGSLQLLLSGKQKAVALAGQPKISYFKTVVRSYQKFAMEPIKLTFDHVSLDWEKSVKLELTIPKYGPLISNMTFILPLPRLRSMSDVFSVDSSIYVEDSVTCEIECSWVDNLGAAMIEDAELLIGTHVIGKLTGEWIYMGNSLRAKTENGNLSYKSMLSDSNIMMVPFSEWFSRINRDLYIDNLHYDSVRLRLTLRPLKECVLMRRSQTPFENLHKLT